MTLGARRPRQQGLVALLLAVSLLMTLGTTLVLSELGQRREVGDQQALTQKRLLACAATGSQDDQAREVLGRFLRRAFRRRLRLPNLREGRL